MNAIAMEGSANQMWTTIHSRPIVSNRGEHLNPARTRFMRAFGESSDSSSQAKV
jgi:hypothetical protein